MTREELTEIINTLPPDLRKLTFETTTPAGTTGNFDFDVPRGRGMYYCLNVFSNTALADAGGVTFTTSIDGRNVHENESILSMSPSFDDRETAVNVVGWGGSTFRVQVDNSAGVAEQIIFFTFDFTQANGLNPPSNIG